jgi:WD40 repeat protein
MRQLFFLFSLLACASLRAAPVTALAFSPDGTVIASTSGGALALRDPASGDVKRSLPCEATRLTSLAFAAGADLLAVGGGTPGERGEVRLLAWRTCTWLGTQPFGNDLVMSLAFSPDGRHLAAAGMEKVVRVYRVSDKEPRLTEALELKGHSGSVTAVAFNPDGKIIVTASLDRSLKVWSAADGALLRSLGQHTDAVHCIAFGPMLPDQPDAPSLCVSGSDDRTARVWQPTIGRMVRIVRGHNAPILAATFAPDGRSFFSAGHEGIIRQIDAASDAILFRWPASSEWIHSLAISPDGKTLASGDWQGNITLHPTSREKEKAK